MYRYLSLIRKYPSKKLITRSFLSDLFRGQIKVDTQTKMFLLMVILYILSPIDMIHDHEGYMGWIDDAHLSLFAFYKIICIIKKYMLDFPDLLSKVKLDSALS